MPHFHIHRLYASRTMATSLCSERYKIILCGWRVCADGHLTGQLPVSSSRDSIQKCPKWKSLVLNSLRLRALRRRYKFQDHDAAVALNTTRRSRRLGPLLVRRRESVPRLGLCASPSSADVLVLVDEDVVRVTVVCDLLCLIAVGIAWLESRRIECLHFFSCRPDKSCTHPL